MRCLRVALAASIVAVSLPSSARAAEPLGPIAAGGALLFVLGYAPQALAAASMNTDGDKAVYIPIGGAMKMFARAARADCSKAVEGNCDVGRVLVPAIVSVNLLFETAGLAAMTYAAALAVQQRMTERRKVSWVPWATALPGKVVIGVGGSF